MRNLTPSHLRCGTGLCPSVTELTPEHLRCGGSFSGCSSVNGVENDLLIVGKRVSDDLIAAANAKVGPDEVALRIGSEYFAKFIAQHVDAAVRAERELCAELAQTNWNSMKMLGSAYVDGACDAGKRIATAIRSRGKDNG
jgi:hypothetical protein